MFLGFIKNISLKKIVKKSLPKVYAPSKNKVKTIGLLIDGTRFSQTELLIDELVKKGIDKNNIKVLVYSDKKIKNKDLVYFRLKDISLSKKNSDIGSEIKAFENESFDLLVNYYNQEQIALTYLSVQSKADFKAGFLMDEKRLNHFIIDVPLSDYKLFSEELFKYLKLFNKI